jgi:hypothetical protein
MVNRFCSWSAVIAIHQPLKKSYQAFIPERQLLFNKDYLINLLKSANKIDYEKVCFGFLFAVYPCTQKW